MREYHEYGGYTGDIYVGHTIEKTFLKHWTILPVLAISGEFPCFKRIL